MVPWGTPDITATALEIDLSTTDDSLSSVGQPRLYPFHCFVLDTMKLWYAPPPGLTRRANTLQ